MSSRRARAFGLALLAAATLAPVSRAQAGSPGLAQDATAGTLSVEGRDGKFAVRPLEGLEVAGLEALGAIAIRVDGLRAPEPPGMSAADRAEVALTGGDRLLAAVAGGDGDELRLALLGGVRVGVDVERLSQVVFPSRVPGGPGAVEPAGSGDRLYWLRGGGLDRVDGTLESFESGGVAFDSVLGRRTFPWNEVAALFVEEIGGAKEQAGSGRPVSIDLSDGGRIHARLERLSESGARLQWNESALELPLAAVRQITVDDGSVAFLSRSAPERAVEGWPSGDELGMKWPYQLDRAVTGGPLSSGGKVWSRGIGVHAPSRLEWTLDGQWRELRGSVAIDDSVLLLSYRGSVEFSIHLDDKPEPAWRSGRVRGGEAPLPIPSLSLTGVRKLALVVDMDERAYVADRANWLRMLLVK